MNDDEEVRIQLPDNAFAKTAEPAHGAVDRAVERRIDRTHQERACQADTLERLPDDPGAQCVQVELDVGKLRHTNGV